MTDTSKGSVVEDLYDRIVSRKYTIRRLLLLTDGSSIAIDDIDEMELSEGS